MNSYPQKPVVARPKNVSQGGCLVNRLLGLFLLLLCAAGLSTNASAALFDVKTSDRSLTAESCTPANGFIDPGETNTVSFGPIKNTSGGDLAHVKVTILEQGNVTFPSGQIDLGTVAKDATFNVPFSFRAKGACADSLTPVLHLVTDSGNQDISFDPFQLGATDKKTYSFANAGAITINDYNGDATKLGRASPYPSTISVAGIPEPTSDPTKELVDKVTVTLTGLTHAWSPDIQALLVGSNGKSIVLMANAGGQTDLAAPVNNITLTFDADAASQLPQNSGPITSGSYKLSDYGAGSFPDAGTANANSLSAFNGSNVNGTWKLYVIDTSAGNAGTIAGGWSLAIRTTKITCCGAGQTYPFVDRIAEFVANEDFDGAENVQIATFNVSDLDAAPDTLTVVATSADQTKVVDANLVVEAPNGASNPTRLIKVKKLVANANGNDTITVTVTDAQGHATSSSFNLKINPVNDAPILSDILGQKVNVGTATGPIAFTIGDVETLPENLLVLVGTSDPAKVPIPNIVVTRGGANNAVNVIPASSTVQGDVTITLTVRDLGDGTNGPKETSKSFVVSFTATAGNPTITPLSPVSVDEDASITVPFTIRSGNPNVSADALTLTKVSGNTTLLPLSGIVFNGTGQNRTVTLTPAANANGQVSVTIAVANGALTDSTTFTLTINPKNDAPTITSVGPQVTNEDTTSSDIVFTVGDIEPAGPPLGVTVQSSNPALVPNSFNPADFATAGGFQIVTNAATRTIRIRPAPNQFGKSTITVTVTDTGDPAGSGTGDAPKSTSTTFVLTVNSVNDAPNITAVGNDAGSLVNWGATDPTITIAEDSGSTADATKGQRTIVLSGITPGPSNESSQSVAVSASSDKPDIISIIKVDPASVTGATANTTLTVLLGSNKFTPADSPVTVTLTLADNGGTDLGGVSTTTKKFKINVTPANDAPVLAFPTLPPPLPGQTLSELNVAKNRSFTLPMTVSDVETPKTLINMTATVAGDPAGKFPPGSILFDPSRSLVTFVPTAATVTLPYTVEVTITATDNGATNNGDNPLSVSRTFKVTIRDIEPPSITSSSTDIQTNEDTPATPTLTVTDNKPVSALTFSVKSDNQAVIPNDGVLLGPLSSPAGNNLIGTRSLVIVPAADQFGVANITVTVKDDESLESQVAIKVTVAPVSDAPTLTLRGIIAPTLDANGISHNASITILEDKATSDTSTDSRQLEFDVSDAVNETPPERLVISKTSSNTDLVPLNNIVINGTGTRRTMTVTPAANKNGSATISIIATDESGLSSTGTFTLVVTPVNDAPTINQVNNMSLQENAPEQTVNLTGISPGPDTGQTVVSVVATEQDKGSDPATHNILQITQQPGAPDSNGATSFKFKPRDFRSGTGTITVTVTDSGDTSNEGKKTATMSFDVAVASVNQLPSLSFDASTTTLTIDRTLEPGANTGVIPFYISDTETPSEILTVSAVSSNPTLVPNTQVNLQLGGSFGSRGILVQPLPGQSGTAIINVTVTDVNGGTKTGTINLTVRPGQNPTITLTPNTQTIPANSFTDLVQINVSDAQTPADQLKVGYQDVGLVTSDNPTLVPALPSNIQFGGTGASRVMIVLPRADQTGTANIGVGVKDASGNISTATFVLKVLGSPPTISAATPSSVNVNLGAQSSPVTVTVGDKETFPALLMVTGKSSDQTIIPDSSIFVLGNNTTRSVTVLAGNKGGTATITLTVTDDAGQTATTSFVVNVNDNNTPPTITSVGPQSTTKNKPTGVINFTVGDKETSLANLTVTANSGNAALVPNNSANLLLLTSPNNAAQRSLVITPATDKTGTALITLTVSDAGGKTASTTFALSVTDQPVAGVPNDFNGDRSQDIILQTPVVISPLG